MSALAGRGLVAYAAAAAGTQAVLAASSAFLPAALEARGATPGAIGAALALGPLVGLVVQPAVALAGDRAPARVGRRLPYVVALAPLCAAALVGVGLARSFGPTLAAVVVAFAAYHGYSGPYRASLVDHVAAADLTRATALQALFKGLGTVVTFGLGAALLGRLGPVAPWALVATIVLVTTAASARAMARSRAPAPASSPAPAAATTGLAWLFAAHAAWWIALHALFGFTVLFTVRDVLGVPAADVEASRRAVSEAVGVLAVFAVVGLATAVPIGRAARRFGERRVLAAGLVALAIALGAALAVRSMAGVVALAVVFGVGFACVQVVPYALAVRLQPAGREGAVAAAFNLIIEIAQLVALALVGAVAERTGTYRVTYVVALAAVAISLALLARVRVPDQPNG